MRSVPTTRTVEHDSLASTSDSFFKDGRRISVGDCALFKPPQDYPPFIGIIRWLSFSKDNNNLLLGVNWLYRPAEVNLGKGVQLDAAPNEIFYSFHKDEIPAASLLHPCKVAFLPKGVELSSGISSFVCRRVYDIANKCLWWLTDQDYIDERQEEVDQLLYKTRTEMHATVQPGGRSPKQLSINTSSQLKPASDNVQSSSTSYPSQVKRKKREDRDQGSEPSKRECSSKSDDGDSGQVKAGSVLKSEIAKITEKGGLINAAGVEKLVQLMQPDREERKIDLVCRSMLAGVIAGTDRFDCLSWFVQLKGLPILDEWLQDIHRGKIGDGSSVPKNGDKSVEEFLLVLLRALDKLPVNLHALQMCNIGRSVNHLRTNKNIEIQKKARSLVDTWKKRVEAEMNSIDSKSGSSQPVSWSSKSRIPEVSHGGNRHPGVSSEIATKSSVTHISASKTTSSMKPVRGETTTKSASSSPRPMRGGALSSGSGKDGHPRISVGSASDLPLTTAREEKSSSSSQSHNCSQSLSGKEDARSSTAGSMSVNKISSGTSRHQKLINGFPVSVVQRETGSSRTSSLHRTSVLERSSVSGLTCEKAVVPVVEGNSRKLIVKIPNRGRSPAESGSGASFEDRSLLNGRASSPVRLDKHDQFVSNSKEKGDGYRANITPDVNTEFCQSNDFKDLLTGSDEGSGSPDAVHDEERRTVDDTRKSSEVSKAGSSSSGNELKSGKLNEASFSSMNALIESCVKCSEANASLSVGDDVGIKLLASVAAGEISKSDLVSPTQSPQRNTPVLENTRSELSPTDILAQGQSKPDNSDDSDNGENGKQYGFVGISRSNAGLGSSEHASAGFSGDRKISSFSSEEPPVCKSSSVDLQPTADPFVETSEKLDEIKGAASPSGMSKKLTDVEVSNTEERVVTNNSSLDGLPDIKPRGNNPLFRVNDPSVKDEKRGVEGSSSSHLLENEGEHVVDQRLDGGGYAEQKPPTMKMDPEPVDEADEELPHSSSSVKNLVLEVDESSVRKAEKMDTSSLLGQDKEQFDREAENLRDNVNQGLVGLSSSFTNQKSECVEENIDGAEVREHPSGEVHHKESPASPSQGTEPDEGLRESKVTDVEAEETEECASTTADISSFSASGPPHMDAKVKFDLNEGVVGDDEKFGEPLNKLTALSAYPSVHLMNQLPFPVSSVSGSLPASITVAAAAKRPFLPPEDLLRCKGELGWKGSAATSAFRPAEPRKVPEVVPMVMTNIPIPDATATGHGRPTLDIDLNAPGEGVLDDMASQDTVAATVSAFKCDLATACGSGRLHLDLNQVDEGNDMVQHSTCSGRGLQFPLLPVKSSSSSGGFPNGEVRRDFDLNNGPALEDTSAEPIFNRRSGGSMQQQPPVGGIRMNNAEIGNFSSSWFAPPGNAFSPVALPSILSNRGEKPFPGMAPGAPQIVAPGGAPQRILGPSTGGSHFTPDVYWGSVLSSSPTVPFPTTPFQYPVFPFGTSFPMPSSTLTAGSATYMDSSSGGRICFPATNNSQLQGPAAGSSQYPRPYMVSNLQDGSSNGGMENNRKWSRQGLDLNAGPGGPDIEGRDETFCLPSRQHSFASQQALVEEQARMLQMAGGLHKRKEPDGGWDTEGIRYKQSSWQ
ncbi:hypothetical protein LguiA_009516 [Lonicera macranthoides]